jgi:hypothetical protein
MILETILVTARFTKRVAVMRSAHRFRLTAVTFGPTKIMKTARQDHYRLNAGCHLAPVVIKVGDSAVSSRYSLSDGAAAFRALSYL